MILIDECKNTTFELGKYCNQKSHPEKMAIFLNKNKVVSRTYCCCILISLLSSIWNAFTTAL